MLSEQQIAANRLNALKSTGPKTAEGKQRSSLNGIRHGLTGQVVVLPEEDLAAFRTFTVEIVASFDPADARERQLAHSYACFQWRINRAAAIEENMFALGHMEEVAENLNIENAAVHNAVTYAKTFRADSRDFDRLSMYTQRLINQADKVLKQLNQFQAERKERFHREITQAAALLRAHRARGSAFDPKEFGFALTSDQVAAFIRRQEYGQQQTKGENNVYGSTNSGNKPGNRPV